MVQTVNKSTFIFKSNVPKSSRATHKRGIIHAFRADRVTTTTSNSGKDEGNEGNEVPLDEDIDNEEDDHEENEESANTPTKKSPKGKGKPNPKVPPLPILSEEHCFAYVHNVKKIDSLIDLLAHHGFNTTGTSTNSNSNSNKLHFIPFSSKSAWNRKYPHATPYLECDVRGRTTGSPYWNSNVNGGGLGAGGLGLMIGLHHLQAMGPPGHLDHHGHGGVVGTIAGGYGEQPPAKKARTEAADSINEEHETSDEGTNVTNQPPTTLPFPPFAPPTMSTIPGAGMAAVAGLAGSAIPAISSMSAIAAMHKKKRGPKLVEQTLLTNMERDELHLQIYRYFQWLNKHMETMEESPVGRRNLTRAGITKSGSNIQAVLKVLETTFKIIEEEKEIQNQIAEQKEFEREREWIQQQNHDPFATDAAPNLPHGQTNQNQDSSKDKDEPPFLEEMLEEHLSQIVSAKEAEREAELEAMGGNEDDGTGDAGGAGKVGMGRGSGAGVGRKKGGHNRDFEDLFERLILFQSEHGHANVPNSYKRDLQLGSWVANLRTKKKALLKKSIPYEPDKPSRLKSSTYLTASRIQRLEAVGFSWVVVNNNKTWEERFDDLIGFYNIHGHFRVPRNGSGGAMGGGSEGLGEWVHLQRKLHNKKDKSFMKFRAPKLDEIGFEWQPRKHALLSWEERFAQLVEFGRMYGHYNVPCPNTEDEGKYGPIDTNSETQKALRFHRWVERIHAEYRSFQAGGKTKLLNETRVRQLLDLGIVH